MSNPASYKRMTLRQQDFLDSAAGMAAKSDLKVMAESPDYNTQSQFSSRMVDGMPFVDRHMQYLCDHPNLNPQQYISNLRLMTKIK
jgi:hypothetical protein